MTIEFADPGLATVVVWIFIGIGAVSLLLFAVGLWADIEGMWLSGMCLFLAGVLVSTFALPDAYDSAITSEKVRALEQSGFESVSLTGDRFTADMNGRFYHGVLVDLSPESGYAYRVLELTDTKDTP